MHKKLLFIPLLVFLGLIAVFATQLFRNSHGDDPTKLESVLIGQPVPQFKLEDLAEPGKLYDQSIFKGEPLLLNIWATWCSTCYVEHQYLNTLASQGVKIIGMNYKDDRTKAVNWLDKLGNPYLISLFDGSGMLGLDLGVYGAPETFVIDAQGVIRYRHASEVSERSWNEDIKPIYDQLIEEAKQ